MTETFCHSGVARDFRSACRAQSAANLGGLVMNRKDIPEFEAWKAMLPKHSRHELE
jgi:hypothetical protein